MIRKTVLSAGVVALALTPLAAQQRAVIQAPTAVRARVATPLAATPALSAEQLAQVALADGLPEELTRNEQSQLNRVSERLRHKDRAAAQAAWEQAIESIRRRRASVETDALANWVLNEAYLASNPDLQMYAEKVRFFNDQKEAAYLARSELQAQKADLDAGRSAGTRTARPIQLTATYRPGARPVGTADPRPATVDSVVEELQRITVLCNTADSNSQQANLELQNAVQKQQQTLQTISNVSKMLHDTAMAVIRKIG